ncbi:MAG: hypothetical protein K9L78_04420 [Victivallales bacterium]|nr:hypothetical protein [Victivallales bacterium]MCF7889348.1 hypothetical protein [Victivallales bacterium]
MDNEKIKKLAVASKRNYYIMQAFTYLTAVIFFIAVYLYSTNTLTRFVSYIYYFFFSMAIISLVLGIVFNKQISNNKDIVNYFINSDPVYLTKFVRNRFINGFINIILIILLIVSFFMKGIRLQIVNNIFFILIIFSYWFSSYNYYMMFNKWHNPK